MLAHASGLQREPPGEVWETLDFPGETQLLGRLAEAEAAFREEIRDFPASPLARTGLAMLYASQGKSDRALQTLEALVALKTPEALYAAVRTYEILGDRESAARLRLEIRRAFPAARERSRPPV